MKECFLNAIDRLVWQSEEEYILSEKQRECMSCYHFQQCFTLSLGRTVGRILVQLESLQYAPEDNDNGSSYIIDVEDD